MTRSGIKTIVRETMEECLSPETDLLREIRGIRETVIRVDTRNDAFLARMEEAFDRIAAVEDSCSVKKIKIAHLEGLVPIVVGAPGHAPGLIQRVSAIEAAVPTLAAAHRLEALERTAITWIQAAALASFFGICAGIVAAFITVAAHFHFIGGADK